MKSIYRMALILMTLLLLTAGCGGGGDDNDSGSTTDTYRGAWYENDGDKGTFTLSITLNEGSFSGTYEKVKTTGEGGNYSYSISGTYSGDSFQGTDSDSNEYLFELKEHPTDSSEEILIGSYYDPNGGERAVLRSTNSQAYNSIDGLITLSNMTDHSGVNVFLQENTSYSTITDKNGMYCLFGFSNGTYTVEASKNGYTDSNSSGWTFNDGTTHHQYGNMTLY